MTLVDTTLWIAWLRNASPAVIATIDRLLDDGKAAICPVILQEIVQGASDQSALRSLRSRFSQLPMLMLDDHVRLHIEAAELYARCRWQGVTPRSPHDCIIAVTAMQAQTTLLHDDRDFERMARVEPGLLSQRLRV